MTMQSVVDNLMPLPPSFVDDGRLLLAKAPGLTKYHRDHSGLHEECIGAQCAFCDEGFRLYKASVYFVLTLKDSKVRVVLLDDREYSIKNRRTKRAFRAMLKTCSPRDRQFIPVEYGIVRLKHLGVDVPVEGSNASSFDAFAEYAEYNPGFLLDEYFYSKS